MKLINIKGYTYYIKGGTNTGVIKLDDNNVLIIDPGLGGRRPRKIMELLNENNMSIKYIINTHEHEDHYEGCSQMKEIDNNIKILSSEEAKIFIDYPHKFADCLVGGKSNNFLNSNLSRQKNNTAKIDDVIEEGNIVLNNRKFEIIKLRGHSEGSIGILTEDKVLFIGDLFIEEKLLSKFNLLLMYDVKSYLESIDKIKDIDFEYLVLGHGRKIYSKENISLISQKHKDVINKYINQTKELLKSPITIDNILKNIINNNNLSCNYKEYQFFRSSIMSIISYLEELNQIDYSIESGDLLYYSKKV